MREERIHLNESNKIPGQLNDLFQGIYNRAEFEELQESALSMDELSKTDCLTKSVGGMEEWAKDEGEHHSPEELSCDWYHGTWQYMRLLNVVAVPRWYPFYHETLVSLLRKKPDAHIMISACADLGMLHTVDVAIKEVNATPSIVIYDICNTPLKNSQWYAHRHGLEVKCYCENIITSNIKESSFDIVVTDEFLTVLQGPYKPLITQKWKKILKPEGSVVTTAMIGKPTTPELRQGYEERAMGRLEKYGELLFPKHWASEERKQDLILKIKHFAQFHTRHMIVDEAEIKKLFKDFQHLSCERVTTPGECVNPTDSFQIAAIPGE